MQRTNSAKLDLQVPQQIAHQYWRESGRNSRNWTNLCDCDQLHFGSHWQLALLAHWAESKHLAIFGPIWTQLPLSAAWGRLYCMGRNLWLLWRDIIDTLKRRALFLQRARNVQRWRTVPIIALQHPADACADAHCASERNSPVKFCPSLFRTKISPESVPVSLPV
jgi:hypothetical protein